MHIKTLLFIALLVMGLIVYSIFDPSLNSFFPECPFYKLTGFYCAGCGSQRAIHSLLNGDILSAASYNLMLVVYLPLIVIYYAGEGLSYVFKKTVFEVTIVNKMWFIIASAVLITLFGILRNLPNDLGHVLAPHQRLTILIF